MDSAPTTDILLLIFSFFHYLLHPVYTNEGVGTLVSPGREGRCHNCDIEGMEGTSVVPAAYLRGYIVQILLIAIDQDFYISHKRTYVRDIRKKERGSGTVTRLIYEVLAPQTENFPSLARIFNMI